MSKNITFRTEKKSKRRNRNIITAAVAAALLLLVAVSVAAVMGAGDFDLRTVLGGDPAVTADQTETAPDIPRSDNCWLFWCKDSVSGELRFLWVTRIIMPRGKYIIYSPSVDENVEYENEFGSLAYIFRQYGAEGLTQALEEYCGVKISHHIGSDTEAFKQTVNRFGSVTVDLPDSINYRGSFNLILPRGSNVIKGDTLYKYLVYTGFMQGNTVKLRGEALEGVLRNVINPDNAGGIESIYSRIANILYTDMTVVVFSELRDYANDLFNTGVKETVIAEKPNQIK